MKFKSIITFLFSSIISVSFSFRENTFANQVGNTKEKINTTLKRALNTQEEINDPNVIFELAIEDYKLQFDDYINITALNVIDKENVNLPNFDSGYVAPKYYDVMFEYQKNLESSLTYEQNLKYIELQKRDYNFDRYVTLNNIKYTNLKPDLKYNHINIPVNPINPITPTNQIFPPDIGIMSLDNQQKNAAFLTGGVVTILANAGIGQNVIAAFTAAISTLTTAISTNWLLFLGGVLAVALAVGALIALTVIIVENWDVISSIIEDIKNWFCEQFSAFSNLINAYFDDAIAQGEKSKVAGREKIGDKDITWISKIIKTGSATIFLDLLRRIDDLAVLMRNVKKYYDSKDDKYYMSYWVFEELVPTDFIKDNNVYDLGVSTYTWYNNTARDLMLNGTILLEYPTLNELGKPYQIGYHKFLETEEYTINGFNHYHVFEYRKLKDGEYKYDVVLKGPIHKAHSFFSPLFIKLSDGLIERYPTNP